MGHYYHHEVLGDLVSWDTREEESDASSDAEEVWDPFMDFQEGESERELYILTEPKIEQEEEGLTVTVSDTFERFHPMIYIAPFAGHEISINETADQLRLIFPETIIGLRAVEVTGVINGTEVVERAEDGASLASVSTFMSNLTLDPNGALPFSYSIKYRN